MPNLCVAYGCGKSYRDNVSMFRFPKDRGEFLKWEKQVQRTRHKWVAKTFSFLCSEHFSKDCFEPRPTTLTKNMGAKGLKLKEGAIPTIFIRPPCTKCGGHSTTCTACSPKGKKQSVSTEYQKQDSVSTWKTSPLFKAEFISFRPWTPIWTSITNKKLPSKGVLGTINNSIQTVDLIDV